MGLAGKPEAPEAFVAFEAEDVEIYLSHEIWEHLEDEAGRLRALMPGYGEARFRVENRPSASVLRRHQFDEGQDLSIIQRMLNYMPPTTEPSPRKGLDLSEEDLARMLKALADPSRLSIFNMLMEGVQCNCEIAGRLGFSLSLISHHLRVLHDVGLVHSERDAQDARWIYHSIDRVKLAQLDLALRRLLDTNRIQPRLPSCGPRGCETC